MVTVGVLSSSLEGWKRHFHNGVLKAACVMAAENIKEKEGRRGLGERGRERESTSHTCSTTESWAWSLLAFVIMHETHK